MGYFHLLHLVASIAPPTLRIGVGQIPLIFEQHSNRDGGGQNLNFHVRNSYFETLGNYGSLQFRQKASVILIVHLKHL